MSVKVATVMQIIEKIASKNLALEWDNVGLLIGDPKDSINKILVALDVNFEVVNEALSKKANMIISHHPVIFKPIKNIRKDNPEGALLRKLIINNINVYSAHTNLDLSERGVNKVLFEKLSLIDGEVLKVEKKENLYKFVVFVPRSHVEIIKTVLGDSGAGWIGNYSHCSFSTSGTGSFKPIEGANPYLGTVGVIEHVEEARIETIVPEKILKSVIKAVLKAHPYEEVAYDIYPLANSGKEFGLGQIGYFKTPVHKKDFIEFVKKQLNVSTLKIAGVLPEQIHKVAVCGGSGGNLIQNAFIKGAQVLITGDVGYHQALEAESLGIAVIDAGHGITERIIVPYLAEYLCSEFNAQKIDTEVIISNVNSEPWLFV
jgi:dinuclear metal center YbgI/SA1388 family protein